MHSEICPICNGRGWICKDYPAVPPCKEKKKCHGCNGKGWISVEDKCDSSPYTIPPKPTQWTVTWTAPDHHEYPLVISIESISPYQQIEEGST